MSGYRFEHYRLDVDRRVLIARERVIPLSEKIFGVLLCLVRAAGRTVTKDELIAEVWGQEDTSEATLVQHVSLLRKLLDERPASHKYVLTVPRVGYRFIPRVAHDGEPFVTLGVEAIGDGSQRGEPRIWREYFSGKHWAERRDRNGLNLALRHFSAALRIDRTFAPAWIGIAATYCTSRTMRLPRGTECFRPPSTRSPRRSNSIPDRGWRIACSPRSNWPSGT